MANYFIIGGDGKEYGPITDEELRKWISEGRLNADSRAKAESDAEFRALAQFPEFADSYAQPPATIAPPTATGNVTDDYELDLGECITRAWALVRNNFWPVVGVSALVLFAVVGINQLFGLITNPIVNGMVAKQEINVPGLLIVMGVSVVSAPFSTIFMAGLFKYYLKLIRGEPATISDAFGGFGSRTGQLILLSLVQMTLVMVGYALCIIPGIYLTVAWYLAIPLVIDRQLDFWPAMQLSRRMVSKHWFVVFAAMLVFGLVAMIGIIACGIGIFVTMPVGTIALMYAYETVFGAKKN
ncbi:MAG TPA: DUF4339 domain-containing protein [Verrucomicrobiae bacterium]